MVEASVCVLKILIVVKSQAWQYIPIAPAFRRRARAVCLRPA